jgi:hypothetical protein
MSVIAWRQLLDCLDCNSHCRWWSCCFSLQWYFRFWKHSPRFYIHPWGQHCSQTRLLHFFN